MQYVTYRIVISYKSFEAKAIQLWVRKLMIFRFPRSSGDWRDNIKKLPLKIVKVEPSFATNYLLPPV